MKSIISNYKTEDLKIMNMELISGILCGEYKTELYKIEQEVSQQEKIDFIDNIKNGAMTYYINLFTKWVAEKDNLPRQKGAYKDTINTNSKKAWIRRNAKKLNMNSIDIGTIYDDRLYYDRLRDNMTFDEQEKANLIDYYFHRLLIELERREMKYFKKHDSRCIKLEQFQVYIAKYGQIDNNKKINDIKWNGDENIAESDLDYLISKYQEIEKVFQKVTKEINKKYPQWVYDEEE